MNSHFPSKSSLVAAVCGSFLIACAVLLWRPHQTSPAAEALATDATPAAVLSDHSPAPAPRRVAAAMGAATETSLRLSLETVGEIDLPDGDVERVYRVRVVNDGTWRSLLEAELVSASSGIRIVEGRAELGDLAPGARLLSADTITLRHDPDLRIDSTQLRWRFGEIEGSESAGTVLSGASTELSINALRDYDASIANEPSGAATQFTRQGTVAPEVSAVLTKAATVGQVNAVLRKTGAVIVRMRPGSETITLRLTPPVGNDSVERVASRLQASGAFEWVMPVAGNMANASPGQGGDAAPADEEPELDDHRPR